MKQLRTIDEKTAQALHDRLYFTVRRNLIDRKGHDSFIKDEQARKLTAELIAHLDGLSIDQPPQLPGHSDIGHRAGFEDDLMTRVIRAISGQPHLIPVMNARPARRED